MGLFDRNWWVYAAAAGYLLAAGVCHYAGRRENPRFWNIIALAALAWWQRRRPWPARIALLLLAILVAFTAVRMVSLSPVDRYLGQELTGIRRHVWIELAAIATLTLAAARQATRPARHPLNQPTAPPPTP